MALKKRGFLILDDVGENVAVDCNRYAQCVTEGMRCRLG